jgi:hypothetical protein
LRIGIKTENGKSKPTLVGKLVLVTGGAGFIGSALLWELNRRGCANVVVADFAAHAGKRGNLASLKFTDYVEPSALLGRLQSGALGKFNIVFHLGACSSTTETDEEFRARIISSTWDGRLGAQVRVLRLRPPQQPMGTAARAWMITISVCRTAATVELTGRPRRWIFMRGVRMAETRCRSSISTSFRTKSTGEMRKGSKSFTQVQEPGVIRLFKSYRPNMNMASSAVIFT